MTFGPATAIQARLQDDLNGDVRRCAISLDVVVEVEIFTFETGFPALREVDQRAVEAAAQDLELCDAVEEAPRQIAHLAAPRMFVQFGGKCDFQPVVESGNRSAHEFLETGISRIIVRRFARRGGLLEFFNERSQLADCLLWRDQRENARLSVRRT
jgi:hypothetical protein